jgi:hypothetical protein
MMGIYKILDEKGKVVNRIIADNEDFCKGQGYRYEYEGEVAAVEALTPIDPLQELKDKVDALTALVAGMQK